MSRVRVRVALFVMLLAACRADDVPDAELLFERHGERVGSLSLRTLAAYVAPREVRTNDPYYGRIKRFRALALTPLLERVFGAPAASLRRETFVLRARDGYALPISGERLLEDGAFIAFEDLDVPGFAPIGPQQVSPAPAYLVWEGDARLDLETHPRPWQLSAIAIVRFEALYPHVAPTGEPSESPAMRGFALFREHCIKCHAINREGGHVGPDLNVPQSIVEYRPEAQIRAYISDPATFRYGAMPPHPGLGEDELDALVAYFRAMSLRKHDSGETPSR